MFEEEEINQFLLGADDENRFLLLGKAVAVVALCGGNRMDELRKLTMNDVRPVSKGFEVTFTHSKELGHTHPHKYFICTFHCQSY